MANIVSEKRELDKLYAQIPLDLLYRQDLPEGISRGTILLIYAVLDDHCAKQGNRQGQAWPGYVRLQELTGTGRGQIAAALKWLQQIGKLEAVGEMIETHDRKGRTVQRMKINTWLLTARVVPNQNQVVPNRNYTSLESELLTSSKSEHEQESLRTITKEQTSSSHGETATSDGKDDGIGKEAKQALDYWCAGFKEATGSMPALTPAKDMRLLKERLRYPGSDEVKRVLDYVLDRPNDHYLPHDLAAVLSARWFNEMLMRSKCNEQVEP